MELKQKVKQFFLAMRSKAEELKKRLLERISSKKNVENVPAELSEVGGQADEKKSKIKRWFERMIPKRSPSEEKKQNTFTTLFGKKAEGNVSQTIMDTIAQKAEQQKVKNNSVAPAKNTEEKWLLASSLFLQFVLVFLLVSSAFFYVTNIDEKNQVLGWVGVEQNNASRLAASFAKLDEREQEKTRLKQQITQYGQGYNDRNKEFVAKVVETRLDWEEMIRKINEVTESVYEKNSLLQYVQYSNFSYDVDKSQLVLSGQLSDPKGRNLTKLAELEEAFRFYPSDKNDPEDGKKPYFYQVQEFRTLSKSINGETNRYLSNFSLSLSTKEKEPEL
ncbi:hypothetical protein IPJ72_05030 [Candidatus Peregrinibacteria bacterium]|nr:MAG: hypothetical protein IPJ72_05030 [Candidatus Peregrinibacteria bacterium]